MSLKLLKEGEGRNRSTAMKVLLVAGVITCLVGLLMLSKLSSSQLSTNTVSAANKFSTGDRIETTTKVKVRATPSLTGTILGAQATSSFGTVVGGPVASSGYNWWQLNYDIAPDGWSVENYLAKAPAVTVSASPTAATVVSGGTKQFTATVSNAGNKSVTWSATAGSISTAGLFTALTVSATTTMTVLATSQADTTKSASAVATVTAASTSSSGTSIPLMDMNQSQTYKGFQGGLYENSSDSVPADHSTAGLAAAAKVQSLDANGNPSSGGKVVFRCSIRLLYSLRTIPLLTRPVGVERMLRIYFLQQWFNLSDAGVGRGAVRLGGDAAVRGH